MDPLRRPEEAPCFVPSVRPRRCSRLHFGGLTASTIPLFLLLLSCRRLSDTSSLSVLLHCVLVEEDLWARSRYPKNIAPFLPPARLPLGSPFSPFPLSVLFPFYILSFCLSLLQRRQSACFYGDSVARRPDTSAPPPDFRSVTAALPSTERTVCFPLCHSCL